MDNPVEEGCESETGLEEVQVHQPDIFTREIKCLCQQWQSNQWIRKHGEHATTPHPIPDPMALIQRMAPLPPTKKVERKQPSYAPVSFKPVTGGFQDFCGFHQCSTT